MRAYEFITEGHTQAKISKRQQSATRGLHIFRDPGGYDRIYELHRLMMAVARTDGTEPVDLDAESWVGKFNTAHPYTEVEQDMLKMALKSIGSDTHDLNKGDLRSQELDIVNKISPVTSFKGYPR